MFFKIFFFQIELKTLYKNLKKIHKKRERLKSSI